MSRNWLRACSLYVTDQGGKSTPDLGKLRVRFNIVSHTLQSPNIAEIIVSNPSRDTVALVQKEFTRITLSGGYEGNTGVLFSGSVVQSQYGEKEFNTDPLLRIWASDSDTAYNNSTLNKTLAAGATPQDIVNACLDALKPFGVTLGQVVGVDLSQPVFPRGVVLSGMVRDYLREVTTSKNTTFYIENGQLSIFGKNASLSGGEVVLSATTGMIGQPVQQPAGIIVRCLINPLIRVNSNVKISASSIVQTKFSNPTLQTSDAYQQALLEQQQVNAGTYRVLHIDTDGDTRAGPWFQTLTCIGAGASVNAVQAGLGYS